PLALVFAASLLRGAEEAWPAIFAPKTPPAPTILSRTRAETPVSERTRSILNTASFQALARAKPFEIPNDPTGRVSLLSEPDGNATMMKAFVVRSVPMQPTERPTPDSPLLDFLKTGKFYRAENLEIGLQMKILKQPDLQVLRTVEFSRL